MDCELLKVDILMVVQGTVDCGLLATVPNCCCVVVEQVDIFTVVQLKVLLVVNSLQLSQAAVVFRILEEFYNSSNTFYKRTWS